MAEAKNSGSKLTFPYQTALQRLNGYDYNSRLFMGDHFEAFNIRIDNPQFALLYAKMKYVKANVAGLLSKVVADMLFSEPIKIMVKDGDQEWVDNFVKENKLHIQLYESALSNSYKGDALFKLRVGNRHPLSSTEEKSAIVEDITPSIYFPKINEFNVRQEPDLVELAWTFERGGNKYLRKEIHTPNKIENRVYLMEGNEIKSEADIGIIGEAGLVQVQETGVERPLLFHVPNWKTGDRHFGISDYYDLDTIFYAINNRLTKLDTILDKHSDPILAVPEGIFDEEGKVKKENLGMVEVPDGMSVNDGKPQYVIWDASLEQCFKELESLIDVFYMVGEVSPHVLGMGKDGGAAESGRALKFKLLRTIAKTARKKLYYDAAIKEIIYNAQVLAKKWNIKAMGKSLSKEPVYPEIVWADGLPKDTTEQVDIEVKRIDAGLTTTKDAIMRIDDIDEDMAEDQVKEIQDENKINMPVVNTTPNSNFFSKSTSGTDASNKATTNVNNNQGKPANGMTNYNS